MKNSGLIIRASELLPEVYSAESRDFQVFTRLMDAVYNSCKYNTDTITYVNDPKNIDNRLLKLLADKLGIDEEDSNLLFDDEIRLILCCLPYLIRNKGSLVALIGLINIYFKIYHITGDYTISVTNKGTVIQDIQLGERTIVLGVDTLKLSLTLLKVMAKYLLPPGYTFFVYFYTKVDGRVNMEYEDNLTLLYTSNVLNAEIDLTIPDFINDLIYDWTDPDLLADEGPLIRLARVELLISAIDSHAIGNLYSIYSKEFFIGYLNQADKATIKTNFEKTFTDPTGTKYNPDRDPTTWDFIKHKEKTVTNPYLRFDIVNMTLPSGTIVKKIFIPEYRLLNLPINIVNSFANKTALNKAFPKKAFDALEYDELKTYKKDDWCIQAGSLYKANITIGEPEEWNGKHWDKKLDDGDYLKIKSDSAYNDDITFYTYNLYTTASGIILGKLNFSMKYPYQLCWRTIKEGSLAIINDVSEIEVGTKPGKSPTPEPIIGTATGEVYFITTYDQSCLFNKLTFKGSYEATDNLNMNLILNSGSIEGKEFDYCCIFNAYNPFLYNKNPDGTFKETLLTSRKAVRELPALAGLNHLRFNLTNSKYYTGLCSNLLYRNILDYTKFSASAFVNDVAFIVGTSDSEERDSMSGIPYKYGHITVDGTAYGYTRFTVLTDIHILKDHYYFLTGCPNNGSITSYFLESDSKAFTTAFADTGDGIILKAADEDYKARINIIVRDLIEVTNLKFIPELFDLTTAFPETVIPDDITVEKLYKWLWKEVKEGAEIQDQYAPELELKDNTVLWRRGGDYYIKYRASKEKAPVWQKYTYPLFLVKTILSRSY